MSDIFTEQDDQETDKRGPEVYIVFFNCSEFM